MRASVPVLCWVSTGGDDGSVQVPSVRSESLPAVIELVRAHDSAPVVRLDGLSAALHSQSAPTVSAALDDQLRQAIELSSVRQYDK